MRKIFVTAIALFALGSSSALAGEPICDAKCQAYKHATSRGPTPYRDATACVYFKQASIDNVVIRFYDAAGHEFDANDPLHSRKAAGREDKICPGAHWFKKVVESGGHAELCNNFESRRLEVMHINTILSLGRTPVGKWVYLDKPRQ